MELERSAAEHRGEIAQPRKTGQSECRPTSGALVHRDGRPARRRQCARRLLAVQRRRPQPQLRRQIHSRLYREYHVVLRSRTPARAPHLAPMARHDHPRRRRRPAHDPPRSSSTSLGQRTRSIRQCAGQRQHVLEPLRLDCWRDRWHELNPEPQRSNDSRSSIEARLTSAAFVCAEDCHRNARHARDLSLCLPRALAKCSQCGAGNHEQRLAYSLTNAHPSYFSFAT